MTTGGSCSVRLTGSTKLPRQTYGGWRIRRSCRITGRLELLSSRAGLRELALDRKEVDNEARFLILFCSCPFDWRLQRQRTTAGTDAGLAADTGSKVAGVSSVAT